MKKNSKKYDLVIFDFDGTLVDTAPDIALYANQILKDYGFEEKSLEEVKKAVGHGVHELLKDLSSDGFAGKEALLDEAVLEFKKRYTENPVIHSKPYPFVLEMLNGPLQKVKKAIATNKPHELTLKILDLLKMNHYFNPVIGAGLDFPHKPDPAAVFFIMQSCGIKKKQVLFIGDSRVDYETSKNAGIDFVSMSYGYDSWRPEPSIPLLNCASGWRQHLDL